LTGQSPTTPPPAGSAAAVDGGPASFGVGPASVVTSAGDPSPSAEGGAHSALRHRRDELAEQVVELHWDLGGLAYEMAIRDHFRLDVLVRRAAVLQERDAELAEVERLLAMEEGALAGHCTQCGAPHSRGAVYCWQCGTTLMQRLPSASAAGSEAVMQALLSSGSGEPESQQ
jgi:hypothetical protein